MSESLTTRLEQAHHAFKQKRYESAFDMYEALSNDGHAESQVFLAWMYTEGLGCTADIHEADKLYERAAALGNPVGTFYRARWLTKNGEHEKAFGLYQVAAKAQHLPSIFRVGYSFSRGAGVGPNLDKAYDSLRKAAAQGHILAMREIAVLDLAGQRGSFNRLLSPFRFLTMLIRGFFLQAVDRHSDRLRA